MGKEHIKDGVNTMTVIHDVQDIIEKMLAAAVCTLSLHCTISAQ